MNIYGFIPARMAASRFPGKPLALIKNIPMVKHVYERALFFKKWKNLFITTCDNEILQFSKKNNYPVIMTSNKHKRALDRVYEAAKNIKIVRDNDIVICVQGDEPLLTPNMISNSIKPLLNSSVIKGTVLAMEIVEEEQFQDPNVLKIIHKKNGEVLYTSRAPIPYCKKFSKKLNAKRIYGIFAFRWKFLKKFNLTKESSLEILESCDSNRICESYGGQFIAFQKYKKSYSVDCLQDLKKVEKFMSKDKLFLKYKNK
jgi:3-deoxy-manno-octulosonate cytidylyltransferase (CMP-KDO synthetase)